MFTKKNLVWKLGRFLNEEGRVSWQDRRFWFGVFLGAAFVLAVGELR